MKLMGNIYGCGECTDSFSTSKSLVIHVQNKHQLLRIDNNKKKVKELIFQNVSSNEKSKKVANDKHLLSNHGIDKSQKNFSEYEIETSNKPIVIPDSATIQNLEKYFDEIKVIHTNVKFETLNPNENAHLSYLCEGEKDENEVEGSTMSKDSRKNCKNINFTNVPKKSLNVIEENENSSFLFQSQTSSREIDNNLEKTFSCQYCKNEFKRIDSCKRHERTHTQHSSQQLLHCSYCQKSFKRKDVLRTHERIHTGENHYKCGYCNLAFGRLYLLRNHESIHTGKDQIEIGIKHKSTLPIGTKSESKYRVLNISWNPLPLLYHCPSTF